jgi:hypothetical protein
VTTTRTPASPETLRAVIANIGADRANARTEHADEAPDPWTPWYAPVMVLAGTAYEGKPWLWLACRCGWHLGFSEQIDPDYLAKEAKTHRGECEVAKQLLAAAQSEAGEAPLPDSIGQLMDRS